MHSQSGSMQLREILGVVWRRRVVVAIVFVLFVGAAVAYAHSRPKRYESGATIAFMPSGRQGQFIPPESLSALLATYAVIARSDQNLTAASTLLGHPVPGSVSTSTEVGSWILGISSEASTPEAAAETVKATTEALVDSVRGNPEVAPTVINPAVASSVPTQPRPGLIVSVAVVIGLVAALLFAFLVESLAGAPDRPSGAAIANAEPSERTAELITDHHA